MFAWNVAEMSNFAIDCAAVVAYTLRMETAISGDASTWSLTSLYSSLSEWQAEFDRLESESRAYTRFQGHLAESGATLLEYLRFDADYSARFEKASRYARFRKLQNADDTEASEMLSRLDHLWKRIAELAAYERTEKSAISPQHLSELIVQEPRLEPWRYELSEARREAAHALPPEQESILLSASAVMNTGNTNFTTLVDQEIEYAAVSDAQGNAVVASEANFARLYRSEDRDTRRRAQAAYFTALRKHRRSLANYLLADVRKRVFIARTRHYASSLEAALSTDGLPAEAFHTTIGAFTEHLGIWHRYFELRRRQLSLERLAPYDARAPWSTTRIEVPYERAVDWIVGSLRPLGDEYADLAGRALGSGRWIDRYARPGKSRYDAAYSCYADHPRVLVNYDNGFRAASLLAHELGHALHFFYASKSQPYQVAQCKRFTTEIVANCHQALLRRYLLEHLADPDLHLAVLEEEMGFFQDYYFFNPTISRLELEIHERVSKGGDLNPEFLTERTSELFQEAYGSALEPNEFLGCLWMSSGILHQNFYAFQYLTGFAGGQRLADLIADGRPEVVGQFLELLRAGSSAPQLEVLKTVGVDFTTQEPVLAGFHALSKRVDRIEELI